MGDGGRLTYRDGRGVRSEWRATVGRESIGSLAVEAVRANGSFRATPALGGPGVDVVQLAVERQSEGFAVLRDLHVETMLEGGRKDGGATYLRLSGAGHVLFPAGSTRLLLRGQAGVASADLPAHRAFVLGGRGTLLGDDYRQWGGRRMALLHPGCRGSPPPRSAAGGACRWPPRSLPAPPSGDLSWLA